MKYHVPGSRWYDATTAEVWFDSAESATAAGFVPAGGEARTSKLSNQALIVPVDLCL